jgi:SAM-dependent methyltransferase
MHEIQLEPGSYQDRDNRVFYCDQRVFRVLGQEAYEHWKRLSTSQFFNTLVAENKIVSSWLTQNLELPQLLVNRVEVALLEHERVPFISYPYEWCFGMLKDAALLQLELLTNALSEGMILKDASPYNIQWTGTHPIFIDVLSFEPLSKGSPWLGYHQFCCLFLYPLLLQAYKNISFHPWLRGNLQGILLDDMYRLLSFYDYWRPGILTQVVLPFLFQSSFSPQEAKQSDTNLLQPFQSLEDTRPLIQKMSVKLRTLIQRMHWTPNSGGWKNYVDSHSYTDSDWQQKTEFVTAIIQERSWDTVWDFGCNTGHFSRIAAKNARYVLALDADHSSIEVLYRSLKTSDNKKILPLVFNITDPSPGLGWQGLERSPLWERGKPDLIMCLALIHHIIIQNNIPMDSFIEWLSKFNAALIIEFVSKADPMVSHMLQYKLDQYADYDHSYFEYCLLQHFEVRRTVVLAGQTRTLYFATPRQRTDR